MQNTNLATKTTQFQILGIDRMSIDDRLELMDQIKQSLPEQLAEEDIPDWHIAVLEERIASYEANPEAGRPAKEVIEEIRNRLRNNP